MVRRCARRVVARSILSFAAANFLALQGLVWWRRPWWMIAAVVRTQLGQAPRRVLNEELIAAASQLRRIPRPTSHLFSLDSDAACGQRRRMLFEEDTVVVEGCSISAAELFDQNDLWLHSDTAESPLLALWKESDMVTKMDASDATGLHACITKAAAKFGLTGRTPQPAGRLDKTTTGLLLCTGNGDLNWIICALGLPKTYIATVNTGSVSDEQLEQLRLGVMIGGKLTKARKAQVIGKASRLRRKPLRHGGQEVVETTTQIELEICEGRFHIVKRMMDAVKLTVKHLHRQAVANLTCELAGVHGPGDSAMVPAAHVRQVLDHCGGDVDQPEGYVAPVDGLRGRGIYNALRCGHLLCILRNGLDDPSDAGRLQDWLERHWTLQDPCLRPLDYLRPGIHRKCKCFT
eukprot:TRINITY_DN23470_c0_g2_i2.p1 TRINITY_DN23470_c0_g2~~TRINITY_DN23470_c0_g2_i2.p1  ORF type:complete len:405 (-),score=48.14 TRINITY_DN23470_c0_g2_i2:218-1432(-)